MLIHQTISSILRASPIILLITSMGANATKEFPIHSYAGTFSPILITGRLHADGISFHNDESGLDDLFWRRFRLGAKTDFDHNLNLRAELDFNLNEADSGDWNRFYRRVTDAHIRWTPADELNLILGKHAAEFTLDGAASSNKLLTPERSVVANNIWFPVRFFTGISLKGNSPRISYTLGGFSASGEAEFSHFDAGYFGLLSMGCKLGEAGVLRLDYVYNNPDYSTSYKSFRGRYEIGTANHEHVMALVFQQMLSDKIGIWADIAASQGIKDDTYSIDQSDLMGMEIMPFVHLSDSFQLVVQYATVIGLDGKSDVIMAPWAYANAERQKVETTHNLLFGLNWFIYGHRLKWQNAVEYNYGEHLGGTGKDYNGYGITSALRMSW